MIAAALTLLGHGSAQPAPVAQKPPAGPNTAAPRFTSTTELVMVPAIVHDGAGNHIKNLKREDFAVFEDGVEQRIASFEEVTASNERPAAAVADNSNGYSNLPATSRGQRTSALHLTIIALDLINTAPEDQIFARNELLRYIGDLAQSNELFSLFVITRNGVRMVHNFTDDPRLLLAAARKIPGTARTLADQPTGEALPSEDPHPGTTPLDASLLAMLQLAEEEDKNDNAFLNKLAASYTLQAIQQLANRYAGIPGRKSLLWLTGGFPFTLSDALESFVGNHPSDPDPNSFAGLARGGRAQLGDILPLYQRVWKDLVNAQMALYPVDVRGLQVEGALPVSTWGAGTRNFAHQAYWNNTERIGTMQAFAEETGGKAYYNTNDLKRSFVDAVKDSASYYLLGYYTNRQRLHPGWHKLAVRVRGRHAQVRARNGFFLAAATAENFGTRLRDLNVAVLSPLDYTAIGVTASWEGVFATGQEGLRKARFKLVLPAGSVTIVDAEENHFLLEVVALVRTREGKIAAPPFSESLESHLKPESAGEMRADGLTYRNALELPPGDYIVHFVVRDGLSGRMGSVSAPLTVQ